MSRPERPKQLLELTVEETMLQLTVRRAQKPDFAAPIVVAKAVHADEIERQLREVGADPQALILEPVGRNTAPAIALAALAVDPDTVLLFMPSDHVIADVTAFHAAIRSALPLAEEGWLVTFGITPDAPETGYGYIHIGEAIGRGVHRVARFVEKPPRDIAEAMVNSGDHAWNGGIFQFRADSFLEALAAHAPTMIESVSPAMRSAR